MANEEEEMEVEEEAVPDTFAMWLVRKPKNVSSLKSGAFLISFIDSGLAGGCEAAAFPEEDVEAETKSLRDTR